MLLMEIDGPLILAQIVVDNAQIAQDNAFPDSVANFSGNRQILLIIVDGQLILDRKSVV